MGITATYIGVIILLCVLIGFVMSVILTLSATASNKIRQDMNRVLDSYNHLLNTKMEEYNSRNILLKNVDKKEDEEEVEEIKKPVETFVDKAQKISSSSFVRREASHRITSLAEGYDAIKNEFRNYAKDIDEKELKAISNKKENSDFEKAVLRIDEMLSIESIYELCLLPNEDQLEFFKNTLESKDMIALEKYLEIHTKKFSCIEFYDWIKTNAISASKEITVRSGDVNTKGVYDPSICEGCQIVTGNKIIDYSISKRDIQ